MHIDILMTQTAQAVFNEAGRIDGGYENGERELIKWEIRKQGISKEQSHLESLSETELEEFAEQLNRRYRFSVQPVQSHTITPLATTKRTKLSFQSLQSKEIIVLAINQLPLIFIDAKEGLLVAFKNTPVDFRSITKKMKHIEGSQICLVDYNTHFSSPSCAPLLFKELSQSFQVSVLTNSPQNFSTQPALIQSFSSHGLKFLSVSGAFVTEQPTVLSQVEECVILLNCLLRWTCKGTSLNDGDVKMEDGVIRQNLAGQLANLELYASHLGNSTFQCVVMTYFNIFVKLGITDPLTHQFQSAHINILREICRIRTKRAQRVTQAYFTCDEHYPVSMKYRKECRMSKFGVKCGKTKYSCSGCNQFCGKQIALCLNCFDRFHREDHHLVLKSCNKSTKRERMLLAKQKAVSQALLRQHQSERKMHQKQSQLQMIIKSMIQI